MKILKTNLVRHYWIPILILSLFCCYRFFDAITNNGRIELINMDGYGSIGGFQAFIDHSHHSPSETLFSDVYKNIRLGDGILEPGPFSIFWKMYFYFWGFLFDSKQINNFSVFFFGLLNGLSMYILAQYLAKNKWVSLISALLMTCLYNFQFRANGHLFGLACMFMPVFLILSLFKLNDKFNFRTILIFSLTNIINLNVNEYYGFYGCWISLFALIFISFNKLYKNEATIKKILSYSLVSLITQLFLLFILYPNTITIKLFNKVAGIDETFVKGVSHATDNIIFYSAKSLNEIITLNPFFDKNSHVLNIPENSYFVGAFIFLFSFILLFLVRKNLKSREKAIVIIGIVIAVVSVLLTMNPNHSLSLVRLNAYIAPMFRVNYRSLVYFDISLICIFTVAVGTIARQYAELSKAKKVFSFFAIGLVLLDSPYPAIWGRLKHQAFPDESFYRDIPKERDDSEFIELPFFSPKQFPPEDSYLYAYNYIAHKHEVLNFPFSESNNPRLVEKIDNFANKLNNLDTTTVEILKSLGVHYFVVNEDKRLKIDTSKLLNLPDIKLLKKVDTKSLYEIVGYKADPYEKNIVLDFISSPTEAVDFSSTCEKELEYYICPKGASLRFFNYLDFDIQVSVTLSARNTLGEVESKIIQHLKSKTYLIKNLKDVESGRLFDSGNKSKIKVLKVEFNRE